MPDSVDQAFLDACRLIRESGPWRVQGVTAQHQGVLPFATLAPWLDDQEFMSVYQRVREHTMVDIFRCHELWSLARQTADIDGDILEVGVWRGGTGAILARAVAGLPDKRVYLADTFTGVVKAGGMDPTYVGGEHADTSVGTVVALMDSVSAPKVELLVGVFPEETRHRIRGRIAMLHCDVDVYESSRDIVEWCLPRLPVGGVILFDDYGFMGCQGITTFCDEFRQRRGFRFLHNLNGHAVFVKVA